MFWVISQICLHSHFTEKRQTTWKLKIMYYKIQLIQDKEINSCLKKQNRTTVKNKQPTVNPAPIQMIVK